MTGLVDLVLIMVGTDEVVGVFTHAPSIGDRSVNGANRNNL